ncbi:hypothetical protein KIW84_057428 [Lathyrus oleraceus]|uniref:Uncharacterized protein n=1 Tax=Pisum sativum TaxID=3888 RepID=A0A9D4X371_PEA|nr:hypothetical protein KIW84_057427 [Pisum sativum]KAI5412798.1 hypothetical protein KIW84_057428 [Pisum sativum]
MQQRALKALVSIAIVWPNEIAKEGEVIEISKVILQADPSIPHTLWESAASVLASILQFSSEFYLEIPVAILERVIFQEFQWQVIEQVLLQMERRGLMPLSASTVEPLQNGLLQFGFKFILLFGLFMLHVQEFEEGNHEIEGSPDCSPSINQCILTSMTAIRPPRQSRFIWSDKTDRQLVIQYVRHRAVLGANYHRIDWTSLTDLPSAPSACRRRMSLLNGNLRFREAVNKLCSMLSERYAKQLEKSQNLSSNKDDCRLLVQSQSSKGELSISPSLPTNGVGEADDLRSGKRKSDASGSSFSDKVKKSKSSFGTEGEIISRREKGFLGIIVSVHRTAVSRADILDLFKENDNNNNDQHFEGNFQVNTAQSSNYSFTDHMLETVDSCDQVPENKSHIESPWEAMAEYVRRLMTVPSDQEQECAVCAEVFMVVYATIMKAGDQGLSMGEISQAINLPGADVDGLVVDALQAFGKAIKVNAYDSVRIVDALYCHKYFFDSRALFSSCQTFLKQDR